MIVDNIATTVLQLSELRKAGVKTAHFIGGTISFVEFFETEDVPEEVPETGFRRRTTKMNTEKQAAQRAEAKEAREREVLFASTGMVPQVAKGGSKE